MVTLVLALASLSAADAKDKYPVTRETYPFVVKVCDFHGVAGYYFDYYLDKTSLTVVRRDCFGNPKKEVLSKQLTNDETTRWSKYLATFPVNKLKAEYSDPSVFDGLQRYFTFKTIRRDRHITVQNVDVAELADLCRKLNDLLPDKLKMGGVGAAVAVPENR